MPRLAPRPSPAGADLLCKYVFKWPTQAIEDRVRAIEHAPLEAAELLLHGPQLLAAGWDGITTS